jgi:ABC-type glycerol-3-phosphate transport system substrate-binding protein
MITVPRAAAALLTGAALALTAACADTEEDAKYDAPDATLTDAATAAAEEIAADYTFDKDSITVLSDLGGDEMDQFLSTYAPFEEATGITVEYEGTRDLLSVLQTRIGGGNPPDVVSNPSIGQMQQLIADGDLVPMDDVLDLPTVQEQYDPGLLDLATGADGELYGIFTTAAVKGLVYYDPTTYDGPTAPATWDELATWTDAEADAGRTPWCIGLESGAASGWPATDWIEQFLLTTDGPDVYDAWRTGELAWTSPEVREAFQAFLDVTTAPCPRRSRPPRPSSGWTSSRRRRSTPRRPVPRSSPVSCWARSTTAPRCRRSCATRPPSSGRPCSPPPACGSRRTRPSRRTPTPPSCSSGPRRSSPRPPRCGSTPPTPCRATSTRRSGPRRSPR